MNPGRDACQSWVLRSLSGWVVASPSSGTPMSTLPGVGLMLTATTAPSGTPDTDPFHNKIKDKQTQKAPMSTIHKSLHVIDNPTVGSSPILDICVDLSKSLSIKSAFPNFFFLLPLLSHPFFTALLTTFNNNSKQTINPSPSKPAVSLSPLNPRFSHFDRQTKPPNH
ncbi:hypothetical protein VNO80_21692 [Phaseolus coccineus]|uniref:Uncharacterized protein n=1 Tax=Phaseolus coccineus TaxID=3886 RepID=A0AAN9QR58_PHACN